MSAAIRAAHYTKCRCGDWISPGDMIVFVDDAATHEECEPSPEAWETSAPPTVKRLHQLLETRGELSRYLIDNNADINVLPQEVTQKIIDVMQVESDLWNLVQYVVDEHRDPVKEKRNQLEEFEKTVLQHEAAARRRARGNL